MGASLSGALAPVPYMKFEIANATDPRHLVGWYYRHRHGIYHPIQTNKLRGGGHFRRGTEAKKRKQKKGEKKLRVVVPSCEFEWCKKNIIYV